MNDEADEWEVKMVQERHHDLELSVEQAGQVLRFEEENKIGRGELPEDFFSYWEERDYELDNFQRILSPQQLITYKAQADENIRRYEAQLVKMDEDQGKWVDYYRDLTAWCKDTFIPAWSRDQLQASLILFIEQDKIKLLRAEYRKYADQEKRTARIHHYRNSRLFQPLHLQSTIGRLECQHLSGYPFTYMGFRAKADPATQAVADFLLQKYRGYAERGAEFFQRKDDELAAIHQTLKEKYIGSDRIGGWHVTIPGPTDQQAHEQRLLRLLLIEHGKA